MLFFGLCANTRAEFFFNKFHFDSLKKSYSQNITPFVPLDTAILTLNHVSGDNKQLTKSNYNWIDIKSSPLPVITHEFTNQQDTRRFSEIELIKSRWSDLSKMKKKDEEFKIFSTIKTMFEPWFEILKIQYDVIGYQLLKIVLKAVEPGSIKEHREIGIKLVVKPQKMNKSNEIKRSGVVFDRSNQLTVSIGDLLVFYISRHYQA